MHTTHYYKLKLHTAVRYLNGAVTCIMTIRKHPCNRFGPEPKARLLTPSMLYYWCGAAKSKPFAVVLANEIMQHS